jgi:hypothetical protein
MYSTPYVASLRVYEPIESFELQNQLHWSQLELTLETSREEQIKSLRRSITGKPLNLHQDGAHLLVYDGKRYVAPWSTVSRCWVALEDFKNSLPAPLIKFFIPRTLEDSIRSTIEIVENKPSNILTSTWSIPPRWFALFTPEERLRGVNELGYFTILRTSILNAKTRCSFAHQAVMGAFGEGSVEGEVAELNAWLEIFDAKSIVELDYGGLANYLNKQLIDSGEVGLDADTSVEDVSASIAGLASGDGAIAGRGYERLVLRWRRISELELAN